MNRRNPYDWLTEENLHELTSKAVDYAFAHGLCIKANDDTFGCIGILPFSLLPSTLPRDLFLEVQSLQTEVQLVYHKVAYDHEFLTSALESTVKADEFIARLFEIYRTVRNEGKVQPYSLGIIRTDYLLNQGPENKINIKQVESNMIASSFSVMASKITELHRYVMKYLPNNQLKGEILKNDASYECARGLCDAWKLYNNASAVILFVVEDVNNNVLDQRGLEYELHRVNPSIKVLFAKYQDISLKATLDAEHKLYYDGNEVALVYLRTGYHSKFFKSESDWAAQLLIERSQAIKCPSVQYHLAGCKKVQQLLCQSGVLEKFISDPQTLKRLRRTFAAMYGLEQNEEGHKASLLGIENPKKYVLKPQREGGGNNIYDEDVAVKLRSMENSTERNSYILMERIFPPSITNYLVRRRDSCFKEDIVSELGIYGVIIGKEDSVVVNRSNGHLLRSKEASGNEGGIAVGCAFIDSPYLV